MELNKTIVNIMSFFIILLSIVTLHVDIRIFVAFLMVQLVILYPAIIVRPHLLSLLIVFAFSIFPHTDWYDVFPRIDFRFLMLGFGSMIIFLLFRFKKKSTYHFFFIVFTLLILINGLRGFMYGYSPFFVVNEIVMYLYFPVTYMFIVSYFDQWGSLRVFLKRFLMVFLIVSMIISLELLYLYFFETRGGRVLTRQSNIILIGLMIVLVMFRNPSVSRKVKMVFVGLFVLYSISIFITMQRSLWIGTAVSILFAFVVDIIRNKMNVGNIIKLVVIFAILATFSYGIFQRFNLSGNEITERTQNMGNIEEESSLILRFIAYLQVYDIVKSDMTFGKGLGHSSVFRVLSSEPKNLVDNSYVVLIWKMGIVGLIIFLFMFGKLWKQFCYVFRNSSWFHVDIAVIVVGVFLGQLVNSLACVAVSQYYYNYIWGFLIAVLEIVFMNTNISDTVLES